MDELKRKCKARHWAYNNYTCYLLESGRTSNSISVLFGCNASLCNYWKYQEDLSTAVSVLFLLVRKVKMVLGVDILNYL